MQNIQILRPEDKFRNMILECLERAMFADAQGNRKGYNKNMKHFLRLVSPRMKAETRAEITKKEIDMKEKLQKDISGKGRDDANETITTAEYEFFDEIEFIGIHTLFNSGMFPKETGATLTVGKTIKDLNAVGAEIRKDRDVQSVEKEEEDYAFSGDDA